ncbi:aa3-type cytochrome c oxidase subunit IV [Hansschlegelia sp.]|uniref:aa3-type cytochrome c oxidase subunit IV n=1 Tax=Hansschlegelia sp. TaxID=2041892 RepID=UPI002B7D8188|nr:aa3-type cytochrome c oxidase subunit IV [Hansschlegelia sp.]HVI30409.1 aa3-type cytochrome c oxidase subunit IV [Hansschlegelia sp.]
MAEHAVEYATATGNDYAEHERTYTAFLKIAKVFTAHLVVILIALAIGGVKGDWALCGFGIVMAIVAGVIGAMTPKGSVVPVAIAGVVLLGLYVLFG